MKSKSSGILGSGRTQIVVAGHICLDLLPTFESSQAIRPGMLMRIGAARFSTGGAVANTGVALHRLGAKVQLAARIGDDVFGEQVLRLLKTEGPRLADDVRVVRGGVTSYSIVISPPGVDRSFLHCSSENDRFSLSDLHEIDWDRTAIFHFGYPPMMRRMYEHDGRALSRIFALARRRGAMTSLDMCMPDLKGDSGRVDWRAVCRRVLPGVDLFCPSLDELLFMLDRKTYHRLARRKAALASKVTRSALRKLADRCIAMGAGAVMIKLGDRGVYLQTSATGRFNSADVAWRDVDAICPCRVVDVVGTTGSGDCTIAGFLFAMLSRKSPAEAMTWATAVGATCCQAAGATSAITPWRTIENRLKQGWPTLKRSLARE